MVVDNKDTHSQKEKKAVKIINHSQQQHSNQHKIQHPNYKRCSSKATSLRRNYYTNIICRPRENQSFQNNFFNETTPPRRKKYINIICRMCLLHYHIEHLQSWVGMKMKRKRTKLSSATFVFIFFCRNRNRYKTNMKIDIDRN
jgi:hypothetical protein